MNKRSLTFLGMALLFLVNLTACGGGGSGGGSDVTTVTVTGVAAAGAPLSGRVYIKDSSGSSAERSVAIAADGSFTVDVSGMKAPFLLKADGTSDAKSVTFYSFASSAGRANINPLSHLAVVDAYGSDDLASLYAAPDPARMNSLGAALPDAVKTVQAVLNLPLSRFGASTVDFISDPFIANHQGLDLFLDIAEITVSNGTVFLTDRGAESTMLAPLNSLGTSSLDIASRPMTTPGSVSVWPFEPSVEPGKSIAFTAVMVGAAKHQFLWSVVEAGGGTITDSGVYTAPADPGTYHVMAASISDPAKTAMVPVKVAARSINSVAIVPTGGGMFAVRATLSGVSGIKVTVSYDTTTLANPRVEFGAMTAGMIRLANVTIPGKIILAAISANAISGAGDLATITFDPLGSSPGRILSTQTEVVMMNSQGETVGVTIPSSPPLGPVGATPSQAAAILSTDVGG